MSVCPAPRGFVGEFMTLLGTFKVSIPTATFATLGVILSAGYALWLYRKVVFGALTKPSLASIKDLTFRESLTLFPLVALTILFGVYPKPVLDMSAASVQQLVNNYNTAVTAVKAAALRAMIAAVRTTRHELLRVQVISCCRCCRSWCWPSAPWRC